MKRDEKRIQDLIDRACAVLNETGLPFVVWQSATNKVRLVGEHEELFVLLHAGAYLSNAATRHAEAHIEDMSQAILKIREARLDKRISDSMDDEWRDSGAGDDTK